MARQNSTRKKLQEVRIIGGKWKGRKVRFPMAAGLRPTPARLRETIFNWLRPHIHDTACLDLFAGSGVLGFEALSQGAASLTVVDSHSACRDAIQAQATDFDDRLDVQSGDALDYLRRCTTRFDIIFLDPPYDQPDLLMQSLSLVVERALCSNYIYAESRTLAHLHKVAQQSGCAIVRETRAGDAHGALFKPPSHDSTGGRA